MQLGSELLGFSLLYHVQDIICMSCNLFPETLVAFAINKLLVLPFFLLQSPAVSKRLGLTSLRTRSSTISMLSLPMV